MWGCSLTPRTTLPPRRRWPLGSPTCSRRPSKAQAEISTPHRVVFERERERERGSVLYPRAFTIRAHLVHHAPLRRPLTRATSLPLPISQLTQPSYRMMRPFATALRQSADQKSQEDDLSDDNGSSLSPLLADSNSRNSTSLTAADTTTLPSQEETFSLRVKLNDGHSQDYTLDNVNAKLGTVGMLKERILGCYFGEESGANSGSAL